MHKKCISVGSELIKLVPIIKEDYTKREGQKEVKLSLLKTSNKNIYYPNPFKP